jgi:hypothetical protein
MYDDSIYDKYEKLYCRSDGQMTTVSINDWINDQLTVRGRKAVHSVDQCKDCRVVLIHIGANLVCPDCGTSTEHIHDTGHVKRSQAYKRLTHFKDWITKTQAKHNPDIPPELIEKCRVATDYRSVKAVLRKYGMTRYYEDAYWILSIVNPDFKLFKLTVGEEKLLINLFIEVQKLWDEIKPLKRKSIISYPFIITELLDLIDKPDLKIYFHLPRYNKVLEYKTHFKRITNSVSFSRLFLKLRTTATP